MKKILSYAVAAILLGTVTMLVPTMLLKPNYYGQLASGYKAAGHAPSENLVIPDEYSWDERQESFALTVSPLSSILSAGLMLIPSFLLALGVSLYLKKRIF